MVVPEDVRFVLDLRAHDSRVTRLEGNQAFDAGLANRAGDQAFAASMLQSNVPILLDGLFDRVFQFAA
jgi:hypothetical protein